MLVQTTQKCHSLTTNDQISMVPMLDYIQQLLFLQLEIIEMVPNILTELNNIFRRTRCVISNPDSVCYQFGPCVEYVMLNHHAYIETKDNAALKCSS